MRRWVLRIGIALLALIVLVAVLWGISRVRGPSPEQRAALELFEQIPGPAGRNAWPLLWLLQWDVPASQLDAVAAEDVARFNALPPFGDVERGAATARFESVAAERYRDLQPSLADEPASCGMGESGCLEQVRGNRDAHAARLADAGDLVDRVEAIADYDHVHSLMSPALDAPLPRLQWMALPVTRHALWFVDGDPDRALAGSCRAIAGYRKLATNSDTLVVSMVGLATIRGQAALLTEMLAEMPLEHPLPSECDEALAPLQLHELGTCQAMRGEWAWVSSAMERMDTGLSSGERLRAKLVYDPEATAAMRAPRMSWPCSDQAAHLRAQDLPLPAPQMSAGFARFECWANPVGCILADIAAPAYDHYEARAQDAAARIRLLQALVWMRQQGAAGDTRDVRTLLAERPQLLQDGPRSFEVDADGTRLHMSLFTDRPETHWTVPLPPELHAAAAP